MLAQTANRPATSAARDLIARMADYISARHAANDGVTRDDLLLEFSGPQIDAHFEAAKARARNAGKAARQ